MRPWPAKATWLGLALLLTGFVYDVLFAGIPYQDPSPEQTAGYEFHAGIASYVYAAGLGSLLAALCGAIIRFIHQHSWSLD